mmetsp:Transcript_17328/g.37398  ORF Transcript_17328/g.37398 Transcript_17328/m.37398 type:complete len:208 (-) Transcript_17328:891-1514(-)
MPDVVFSFRYRAPVTSADEPALREKIATALRGYGVHSSSMGYDPAGDNATVSVEHYGSIPRWQYNYLQLIAGKIVVQCGISKITSINQYGGECTSAAGGYLSGSTEFEWHVAHEVAKGGIRFLYRYHDYSGWTAGWSNWSPSGKPKEQAPSYSLEWYDNYVRSSDYHAQKAAGTKRHEAVFRTFEEAVVQLVALVQDMDRRTPKVRI